MFIALRSETEMAVCQWCCGEGEDHAGTKTITEVQESSVQDPPCSW